MRLYRKRVYICDYTLQGKSEDLDSTPDSLDDLKFVLRTISDIKDMSLDVELRIHDLQERYVLQIMYYKYTYKCIHIRNKYSSLIKECTSPL